METPNRTARPTRRSTAEPPRRRHRFEAEPEPSRHESGVGPGVDNRSGPVTAPSPTPALRLRAPARNSTLLFRALLLVAAAVALAFTVAALLAPPGPQSGDPTSPDAPPPAVLVQPDR